MGGWEHPPGGVLETPTLGSHGASPGPGAGLGPRTRQAWLFSLDAGRVDRPEAGEQVCRTPAAAPQESRVGGSSQALPRPWNNEPPPGAWPGASCRASPSLGPSAASVLPAAHPAHSPPTVEAAPATSSRGGGNSLQGQSLRTVTGSLGRGGETSLLEDSRPLPSVRPGHQGGPTPSHQPELGQAAGNHCLCWGLC